MTDIRDLGSVRYFVDHVDDAVDFYTNMLGFKLLHRLPMVADVARGRLRLILSGPQTTAAQPVASGAKPRPGGWNRVHLIVDDIEAEVARLREKGARFRNDITAGPGGKQVLIEDSSGNLVELFERAPIH